MQPLAQLSIFIVFGFILMYLNNIKTDSIPVSRISVFVCLIQKRVTERYMNNLLYLFFKK